MRYALGSIAMPVRGCRDQTDIVSNSQAATTWIRSLHRREPNLRIVVLPQGVLSGGHAVLAEWPSSDALTGLVQCARDCGLYIAAADWFAGQLLGFMIGPDGSEITTQQCLVTNESRKPEVAVLDTPVGVLACLPGDDPWFPEYVRLAMFRGAEIILNPCAERLDQQSSARRLARGTRSWENHAIVAAASAAVLHDQREPDRLAAGAGRAEIWDFTGESLAEADAGAITACIDLTALRARRREPWANFPATLRTALYAAYYERAAANSAGADNAALTGPQYEVLLLQSHQVFATQLESRDQTIQQNLQQALLLARPFCLRPSTRLMVMPEFSLQGSAMGKSLDWWEQMGIRIPGPETEQLAAFARACDVFVSGAVLEFDPEWPQRYFNTAFIIAPSGELILRYRKLQCADLNGLLNVTTPGNIHAQYVERYGEQSLVPVVETEIGRLGALICFDSNWPELWRALALQGAEVICNPTSEIHSERNAPWTRAKRAHAAENLLYVASANAGSEQLFEQAPTTHMNRGHSMLIDFHGRVTSCADGGGIVPLIGRVDLGALRRARANRSENVLARFRPALVAAAYRQFPGFPLDCFSVQPMRSAAEGPPLVRQHIDKLLRAGVLR